MKKLLWGALLPALFVLHGCSAPPSAEEQANQATGEKHTVFGRAMDKATDIETDNNIQQINQGLGMNKGEDGKPPATLEAAKASLKGYPAEMWIDKVTGKPLAYDPNTGRVSRAP